MADSPNKLLDAFRTRFGDTLLETKTHRGQVTVVVDAADALSVLTALRDEPDFAFEELIDLCGVDYAAYGDSEWATSESTDKGFSRGVTERGIGRNAAALRRAQPATPQAFRSRFAAVYHLLSVSQNQRVRVRVFAPDDELPVVDSVVGIWASAQWYEREAFDLFGIVFSGHPDLRRILTDYGFIGHPFRKDFPLTGHVEMRYDPDKGRVVYEPVSIESRVLVPRVIRKDHRYVEPDEPGKGAANA